MSRNGGYKIVDLKGVNFTNGVGQTIPGIYEKIENSYHKPILLSGLTIAGVERADRFMEFGLDGTTFTGYLVISDAQSSTITITDANLVTIVI